MAHKQRRPHGPRLGTPLPLHPTSPRGLKADRRYCPGARGAVRLHLTVEPSRTMRGSSGSPAGTAGQATSPTGAVQPRGPGGARSGHRPRRAGVPPTALGIRLGDCRPPGQRATSMARCADRRGHAGVGAPRISPSRLSHSPLRGGRHGRAPLRDGMSIRDLQKAALAARLIAATGHCGHADCIPFDGLLGARRRTGQLVAIPPRRAPAGDDAHNRISRPCCSGT